jgi:hypothetical protein
MRIWTATRATRAIRRYYNQQPRYVHFSWITMDLLSISSVVWIHLLSLVDPPHRLGMLHPTGATCARSGEENVPWTRAGPAGARHGMACGKLPNGFQVTSELGWIVSYSKIPNLQIWGIFFGTSWKLTCSAVWYLSDWPWFPVLGGHLRESADLAGWWGVEVDR